MSDGSLQLTVMFPAGTIGMEGRGATTTKTVTDSPYVTFPRPQVG